MNKDFENLIKLQEIDLRIHELEQSKVMFPHQVVEREAAIAASQQGQDKATSGLAAKHDEVKAINEKAATAQAALDKSQERLNSITTNREYDAVHAEIEGYKATVAATADRLTAAQKEIDRADETLKLAREGLDAVKQEHDPVIADLKEKIASIDSKIADVVAERTVVETLIPKHMLSTYSFIGKRRKDRRVLSLVPGSRTCSVCHRVLEPQVVNEMKRGLKLPQCHSCGSLLIWTEALEQIVDEPAAEPPKPALPRKSVANPVAEPPSGDPAEETGELAETDLGETQLLDDGPELADSEENQ